jgi:hypothetical protein
LSGGERVNPERLEEIRAWAASRHLRGGPHPVGELLAEVERLREALREIAEPAGKHDTENSRWGGNHCRRIAQRALGVSE